MKLIASMNTHNEMGRYLTATVEHLLTYCDEVRVQDDGSDDGSFEWLESVDGVEVTRNEGQSWSENEGELHQSLFNWTLAGEPTHVLAIDADEIVPEGPALREALEGRLERTFLLRMCEVWDTETDPWRIRFDGGWRPHNVGLLYQLPQSGELGTEWLIGGRRMASSRVPAVARHDHATHKAVDLGFDILHLGWADPAAREDRHRRYAELDGGDFHSKQHIDSIMLPDEQIGLSEYLKKTPVIA